MKASTKETEMNDEREMGLLLLLLSLIVNHAFGNGTRIFIETGDNSNMARPGFGGRASVRHSPPTFRSDDAPQKWRPVLPLLIRLEELICA